jgi:hypothetical protein
MRWSSTPGAPSRAGCAENRRALGEILEHGTWLDSTDVDTLLDLSFPGLDELVGLMEIDRFARGGHYDVIVVDTAPTGHTLRLLAAPETVGVVAGVLDALQDEHRVIRDQLARVTRGPEAADRLIASPRGAGHRDRGAAARSPPDVLPVGDPAGDDVGGRESSTRSTRSSAPACTSTKWSSIACCRRRVPVRCAIGAARRNRRRSESSDAVSEVAVACV